MEMSGQLHAPVALPIVYEAKWEPEPVWTLWDRDKSHAPIGNQTQAVRPVTRPCTDWAIPDVWSKSKSFS
jgi:hypothetical protein